MFILTFILLFCTVSTQNTVKSPAVNSNTPLATQMRFTISVDKSTHFAYEPLSMTMKLQNISNASITGCFEPKLDVGKLTILYKKVGGTFTKYTAARQINLPFMLVLPKTLKPSESVTTEEILLFDVITKRFIFDEPGDYQFQAVYEDQATIASTRLESNPITVRINAIPANEHATQNIYKDEKIARIIQHDKFDAAEAIPSAYTFIQQFPASIYFRYVHDGLLWALENQVNSQKATEYEKQLYNTLLRQQ